MVAVLANLVVVHLVSGTAMPIDGWQLQRSTKGRACPHCGQVDVPLYQGNATRRVGGRTSQTHCSAIRAASDA
jgi:hypothetical protein